MYRHLFLLAAFALYTSSVNAQSLYSENSESLPGFGGTIAISDGEIFVGSAPVGWPSGSDPAGVVYRYSRNDDGSWEEAGRLRASDGKYGDEFGRALFAKDGTLVVSAPAMQAVYVFEKVNGEWVEKSKIQPSEALPAGFELAGAYARGGYRSQTISYGNDILSLTTYNSDTSEGTVHAMHKGSSEWHDMGTLITAQAWSILSSGNLIFVGTPEANENKGAVLVYDLTDLHNPLLVAELSGMELDDNALLGRSLALGDGRLYAGAIGHKEHGAVLEYTLGDDSKWALTRTIQEPELEGQVKSSQFGLGLSLSDKNLLIGSRGSAFIVDTDNPDVSFVKLGAPLDQEGRGFGIGLAIEGTVAAVGAPSADFESGRATIYEQDADGNWNLVSAVENDIDRFASISGDEVNCKEGLANELFPCDNVDLLSMVSTGDLAHDRGATLNDIWGWEDPETGKEYVLAGRTDGVSFIDISNPAYPVVVGELMRTEGTPGSWWRDIKVYKDHAYIVADGASDHGMQIFDLRQLRDVAPDAMPVSFKETAHYDKIASSHNIVINEETGFAYAIGSRAGGEGCGGQLHMIDIREPANPVFAGCFTQAEAGGTHDSQCVIYRGDDTDYRGREICLNSNGSSFIIADVTDKANPKTVTVATYPNTAYTHQGWLSEDHNYFYMNDELDEMNKIVDKTRTLIWDVRDLDDPILVKEYYHSVGASDHNLYIKGNLMYQSNYQAGLRILDISDPENPVEAGHFDTAPHSDDVYGFGGSWSNYPYFKSGVIAISSQGEGVFLVRKRDVEL